MQIFLPQYPRQYLQSRKYFLSLLSMIKHVGSKKIAKQHCADAEIIPEYEFDNNTLTIPNNVDDASKLELRADFN